MSGESEDRGLEAMDQEVQQVQEVQWVQISEPIEQQPVAIDTLLQLIFNSHYGRDDLLRLFQGIQFAIQQVAPDLNASSESDTDLLGIQLKRKANHTDEESDNLENLKDLKKGKQEQDKNLLSGQGSGTNSTASAQIPDQQPTLNNFQLGHGSGTNSTVPAPISGQSNSQTATQGSSIPKNTKPPAIIIRANQNWLEIRKYLIDNQITLHNVKCNVDGN